MIRLLRSFSAVTASTNVASFLLLLLVVILLLLGAIVILAALVMLESVLQHAASIAGSLLAGLQRREAVVAVLTIELRCGGSDLTTAEENALHHLALVGARRLEASHRLSKGVLIDVTNRVVIAAIGISGLTVIGGDSDSGALMS